MLKYLFQVTYKNGEIYTQNDEDKPVIAKVGSSFSDVRQDEIQSFFLFNNEHTFSVNLTDGHFEVDGIPFLMHEENDGLKDFRIIFWRRRTHNMEVAVKDGHVLGKTETVVYLFGWEAIDRKGQRVERVMQIF